MVKILRPACLIVVVALALSLAMVLAPGVMGAPVYQRIISDPNETSIPDVQDLQEISAGSDGGTLYFRVSTYQNWVDPFSTVDIGLLLDTDQNVGTGRTDAFGYPEGVHGIGADYIAVVGTEGLGILRWNPSTSSWDTSSPISFSYTNVVNNTNTFEVGIRLSDIGNPRALDIVAVSAMTELWDYAPDTGYATYMIPQAPPVANFSADVQSGDAPLTVKFRDLSTGDITGGSFSFGDGKSHSGPWITLIHTYDNEGIYSACLTVEGPGGTSTKCMDIIVESMVEAPRLSVQNLSVSAVYAQPRQEIAISADVVNTGGAWGTMTVNLVINGQFEQSAQVGVSPGTKQPVRFTVYKTTPGTYLVDVGGATATFYVLEEATPTPASTPRSGLLADGQLGSTGMIAIIAIGVIVLAGIVVAIIVARR